jgi:hypothetical protein
MQPHRLFFRPLFLAITLASLVVAGCSGDSGYPASESTGPLGQHGVCAGCGKSISLVELKNLIDVDGVRFIICSEACEAKVTEAEADHDHHEH